VLRTSGTAEYNDYVYDLTARNACRANSVSTLIVTSREASSDAFVLQAIQHAEAIWLAGGDQATHLEMWCETPLAAAIQASVARGVPIGGTSSGLAIMGEYIYSAEADHKGEPHLPSIIALRDPYHSRITLGRKFLRLPFLDGVFLEPHFIQQGRHGRMGAFLSRFARENHGREVRGIGIDWKTALLVEPGGVGRVVTGPENPFGTATFFRMKASASLCEPGRPLTVLGIEAAMYRAGDRPNLARWSETDGARYHLSFIDGIPEKVLTASRSSTDPGHLPAPTD
jgi:cyanophycinase-like exopeptidase